MNDKLVYFDGGITNNQTPAWVSEWVKMGRNILGDDWEIREDVETVSGITNRKITAIKK